jgi:hypothetical protein
LVMAVLGLVLIGSACAVGYRNTFDGSISSTLAPPGPIARCERHNCSEPGASGRCTRGTCQFGHQWGGDRYRRSKGLCCPSDIRA